MIAKYKNLKVYMDGDYPAVCLNGRNKHLHRVVWEDNFGKIPNGFVVHHKDENKMNWDISNLELLSRSDHVNHHRDIVRRKGIAVIASKNDKVYRFDSIKEAAIECGTYPMSIRRIFDGKQKTANGYVFSRG